MNIDKVIELGGKIKEPGTKLISFSEMEIMSKTGLTTLITLVVGIIFYLGARFLHKRYFKYNQNEFDREIGDFVMLLSKISLFIGFVTFVFSITLAPYQKDRERYNNEIKHWKNEVAKPYINSLEKEKREIIFIKIDPQLSHRTEGSLFLTFGSISSEEVKLTPLVISYKEKDKVVTQTDWIDTSMQLTDDEKPYIEYQNLKKDLGHGIKAGKYNAKVFLPESYTFSEIK